MATHAPFPALYLLPLDNSFYPPKRIPLPQSPNPADNIVRIGRQLNPKSTPSESNGVFESRVLSRQHAEVWLSDGKVLIRDVKSSNGTFINSTRLSPEGVESEPWEIRSDDILDFGIDIIGDQGEVLHRKVAARATCALTEADALRCVRSEQRMFPPSAAPGHASPSHVPSPATGAASAVAIPDAPALRRPLAQQAQGAQPGGLAGMGGMGSERIRPKSGDFDSILARLRDGPRALEEIRLNDEPKPKETSPAPPPHQPAPAAVAAVEPGPSATATATLDSLRIELEQARRQLETATASSASFITPPAPPSSFPSPVPPPIVANSRFLSAELTKLREEVGALQRARTGARSRRRRTRARRREPGVPLPSRVVDNTDGADDDEGWEDLGLGMTSNPPPSPSAHAPIPDSPLAYEHDIGLRPEANEHDDVPAQEKLQLQRQLDGLEQQLGRLQGELRGMQTTQRAPTTVAENDFVLVDAHGEVHNQGPDRERGLGLAALVRRVDRLEDDMGPSASTSSPTDSEEEDDERRREEERRTAEAEAEKIKEALREGMRALQREWDAFRTAVAAEGDMAGAGVEEWLAAHGQRDATGSNGHSKDASTQSSDSEVPFPGRWRRGAGLLTPAGSVSSRAGPTAREGGSDANGSDTGLQTRVTAPVAAHPPASPTANGHIPELQVRPSLSPVAAFKALKKADALLLLGAVGAGAAIVGAAWWGA
ncbi:Monocarboxylate transporter [Mycena kentingensis (nom. inval.)]|nr:Monocarboxylate transporter [Mycena kentingensis (nom. inval.)]